MFHLKSLLFLIFGNDIKDFYFFIVVTFQFHILKDVWKCQSTILYNLCTMFYYNIWFNNFPNRLKFFGKNEIVVKVKPILVMLFQEVCTRRKFLEVD